MITRIIGDQILKALEQVPAVTVTGPRQSGKTTLVKNLLPDIPYFNLEDPEFRNFASGDPKGFLKTAGHHAIFDEIQHVPELFSYIQVEMDRAGQNGMYILTGSNNFQLMERISQSLAGRVSIFHLLPFSIAELNPGKEVSPEEIIHRGSYPRVYNQLMNYQQWYADYITTYLERDLRSLINIGDLSTFRHFIRLCAARTGQLVNLSAMATELAVSYQTIKRWLSVLEASYILFTLNPFHKNLNKRVIKSSKFYFYDTGLLCTLLGIKTPEELTFHYLRGGIFESFIISEIKKLLFNHRIPAEVSFFRDSTGNEVDLILEMEGVTKAIEIKSGKTIAPQFFKGIHFWNKLKENDQSFVIYAGDDIQLRSDATVLNWRETERVII
jgi:uncharacterized protein